MIATFLQMNQSSTYRGGGGVRERFLCILEDSVLNESVHFRKIRRKDEKESEWEQLMVFLQFFYSKDKRWAHK